MTTQPAAVGTESTTATVTSTTADPNSADDTAHASVTVTAAADSPLGKHAIHVDGKPTTGDSTSGSFDVEVVKP